MKRSWIQSNITAIAPGFLTVCLWVTVLPEPINAQEAGCTLVGELVSFCGQPDQWMQIEDNHSVTAASYMIPDQLFAEIMIQEMDTNDGWAVETLQDWVLENFMTANGGITPEVLGSEAAVVSGLSAQTLVIPLTLEGETTVFATTFMVLAERTIKFVTVEIAASYTTAHQRAHSDLLAAIRLSDANE
jgi:hypothetical protein